MFLVSEIIAALIIIIFMLPAFFAAKGSSLSIADIAAEQSKMLGKAAAALLAVFSILVTIQSLISFQFFLTTAVYEQGPKLLYIVLLTIACIYAASLGIEAFSRSAIFVTVLILAGFFIISLLLIPDYNTLYLHTPFYDGIKPVFTEAFATVFRYTELIAFLMLVPYDKTDAKKSFFWLIGIALITSLLIVFLTQTALGDYGRAQTFPVYLLSRVAELSFIQRFDSLYVVLWLFSAFFKVALYIFLAGDCIKKLFAKASSRVVMPVVGIISITSAYCLPNAIKGKNSELWTISGAVYAGLFLLLLPSAILILKKVRKHRKV